PAAVRPGARAVVALVRPDEGTGGDDGRRGRGIAFVVAAAASVLVVFLVGAGVSTGWSARAMPGWLLHSGIGKATDRSAAVGWGIHGLFSSSAGSSVPRSGAPAVVVRHLPALQEAVAAIVLVVALVGGLRMFRRGRAPRIR